MVYPPTIAFGFANLALLGWLAVAAAPLLIHLWNRRRYREVPWAAVEFLLTAIRKNSRRLRLQEWLLLAVRTAILVLAVLAVAEPYLEQLGLDVIPGARTHKVIVLDGSFSMDYRPAQQSRFDRAQEIAKEIVAESRQGDGFTLVLMTERPRAIVSTPAFSIDAFLTELEAVRVTHSGADLPATLAMVEELIDRAAREHPGLDRQEVYFFSDLGRTTWLPEGNSDQQREVRQRITTLASRASLILLDVGQEDAGNLAVTRLENPEGLITVGRDAAVEATIENFSNRPRGPCLVELLVDDTPVADRPINLPAGGNEAVTFTHRFAEPGMHAVAVRVTGDLLAVDNVRWLAAPVKANVSVLCVEGRRGEAAYLCML